MPEAVRLELDRAIARVETQLRSTCRAWVTGPVGSGRTTLLESIAAKHADAVRIELPEMGEADAVAQALLIASAEVATPSQKEELFLSTALVGEKARRIAEWLAAGERLLLVRIPASWRLSPEADRAWERHQASRAGAIVRTWWAAKDLRVVFFSSGPTAAQLGIDDAIHLRIPALDPRFLRSSEIWGSYAHHAEDLANATKEQPEGSLHPLPMRLAVGALALGCDREPVLEAVLTPSSQAVPYLSKAIQHRLRAPERQGVRLAVQKFLKLRVPAPPSSIQKLTAIPPNHAPLLLECIGYGDPVRVSELSRAYLAEIDSSEAFRDFHSAMADSYASADGVTAPWNLARGPLVSWLEKVHHYALAGPQRTKDWNAQILPGPEFYWDRGRALSKAASYDEAAEVYRRCVHTYPDDDYAWHYLGFNLHRAGADRVEAERAYRRAVSIPGAAENPWWNSRLVTFLIEAGRIAEAEEAWRSALASVDPDGERITRNPWLASHLHFWVAKQWLEAGRADRANEIVEAIPKHVLRESDRLSALHHAILDAREEETLGMPVYSFDVPIHERWTKPRVLPPFAEEGVDLVKWFAGQVIEVTSIAVRIAYASTDDRSTLKLTTLEKKSWRETGFGPPYARKGAFVELGVYSDGTHRVVQVAADRRRPPDLGLSATALAYIERWRSPKSPESKS